MRMNDVLVCGRFELTLNQTLIMGIVNVTPDSFSDGGHHDTLDAAIEHAHRLIAEGAHILDIGGESTRPGSPRVSLQDEANRVLPVIEALRDADIPLSVDTYKPEIMRSALDAGADMLNDIRGFASDAALQVAAADRRCGLCVMHMLGEPQTMQAGEPHYDDVVGDVRHFLLRQCQRLIAAGVAPERIVLDPGLGFGKTTEHNYTLLARMRNLGALGYPVLIGLSRKTMIGAVTGKPVDQRVAGSVAGALAAAARGAAIVRVHDVAQTADALAVWEAVESFNEKEA